MTPTERDWSGVDNALEEAIRRLRQAQYARLSWSMDDQQKSEAINRFLHGSRRALDDCAWALEESADGERVAA